MEEKAISTALPSQYKNNPLMLERELPVKKPIFLKRIDEFPIFILPEDFPGKIFTRLSAFKLVNNSSIHKITKYELSK